MGKSMRYVVTGGLATEELSGELLLCDASGTAVHRISGDARQYFESLAGGPAELPDDEVTAALVAAGVIVGDGETGARGGSGALSRRRALALGATAAAVAGVVTVGLPGAAAAQSPAPPPDPFPPAPSGGTAGGTGGDYNPAAPATNTNTFDVTDGRNAFTAVGTASVTWQVVTSLSPPTLLPVTFTYNFQAPPGNPFATGTVTGTAGPISVPATPLNGPYIWYLTASGGEQKIITGNFG